jgi:tyrosinase
LCLRYWDWPLDWENPAKSPVFDSELGFGGNGDPNAPKSVGSGHCVTEGPFSDLRAKYYDNIFTNPNDELLPRCLSRGFADGDTFSGAKFSPEVMTELFSKTTFDEFLFYLEKVPHNGIPLGIQGDFLTYTAPYGKILLMK